MVIDLHLQCMVALLIILVQSPSPIRHAFYETFLHLHIALACIALGFVWHHVYRYSCKFYLYAAIAFWACEVGIPQPDLCPQANPVTL